MLSARETTAEETTVIHKQGLGASERAPGVKELAAKAEGLSSIPGIHAMERENPFLKVGYTSFTQEKGGLTLPSGRVGHRQFVLPPALAPPLCSSSFAESWGTCSLTLFFLRARQGEPPQRHTSPPYPAHWPP